MTRVPIRDCVEDPILIRNWFPVCPIDQLEDDTPLGLTVCDQSVVIWRSSGRLNAWKDQCAHRGAKLSLGKICGDRLQCPYHGWEYNESGACDLIPSDPNGRIPKRAKVLKVYRAVEHAGLIWVNLTDNAQDIQSLAEFDNRDYGVVAAGPFEIETSALRMCENFLDAAHIPFVHDGLLGNSAFAEIPQYDVNSSDQGVYTDNVVVSIPDHGNIDNMIEAEFTYGTISPITVYTARNSSGASITTQRKVLMLAVRPVTETSCCAYFSLAWHGQHNERILAEIIDFDVRVLMQDKPIVESQKPKRLPLGQSEIHVKSDALTSAYRRYVKNSGVTFGTE